MSEHTAAETMTDSTVDSTADAASIDESYDQAQGAYEAAYGSPAAPEMSRGGPPRGELPRRRPFLAAFFSVLPGLGNIYNGLYVRGFTIFAAFWLLGAFTAAENGNPAPFTAPLMIFLWFFNVLDAYRQATLINLGGFVDLGLADLPSFERLTHGALVPGIVLALIGLYGAFRVYFDTHLGWLLQHWPLPIMALGGWLTWQALQARSDRGMDAHQMTAAEGA